MGRLRAVYGATFGRRRTLTFFAVLMVVSFALGSSTNFWLPLRLGYALLFTLVVAAAWTWLGGRGVRVQVSRAADRVQAGQAIVEQLEVRNDSRLPKLWLEIEQRSDLPDHARARVISLGAGRRQQWRQETVCRRRGLFTVGPVLVRSGDPFDLFHSEQRLGQPRQVLVYPQPLDLQHYAVPAANLHGEGRVSRRTHYVTPNAAGLRDYEPGDSMNRIHWPSTVRAGRLLVKTFEQDPAAQTWIVLDLHGAAHAGEGDDASVEYAVTAAASVARLFLDQGRAVGMTMLGRSLAKVEPDRGGPQLRRMLEALAVATPTGDVPLGRLLLQQSPRWGRQTTLVVITASPDPAWVAALLSLTARGVQASVIHLDLRTFGGGAGTEAIIAQLRAAGLQANVVRLGDQLAEVLASALPSGRAASAGERRQKAAVTA